MRSGAVIDDGLKGTVALIQQDRDSSDGSTVIIGSHSHQVEFAVAVEVAHCDPSANGREISGGLEGAITFTRQDRDAITIAQCQVEFAVAVEVTRSTKTGFASVLNVRDG